MTLSLHEHVPLAPLTTLGLGGPARFLARCQTADDVAGALRWAATRRLGVTVLGGGSNVVFPDEGLDGLVVQIAIGGVTFADATGEVEAGAGAPWDALVREAVERGWAGIECLSGIPGTVGGTPIQNVGAYGQDVAATIRRVTVLDRSTLEPRTFTRDECGFGYRTSRFKEQDRNRFVVTGVGYRLSPGGSPRTESPDVAKAVGRSATLPEVRKAVLAIRRSKGMVYDPGDPDTRSAGSFFTNPVLSGSAFRDLEERCRTLGLTAPPHYPAEQEEVKVPAAWLVEKAGFSKGLRRGGAGVSPRHALALVNYGGTTAELLELADAIVAGVRDRFGIRLAPEAEIVKRAGGSAATRRSPHGFPRPPREREP